MPCLHSLQAVIQTENEKRSTDECTLCYEKENLKGCLTCENAFCVLHIDMHVEIFPDHSFFAVLKSSDNAEVDYQEFPSVYCAHCRCDISKEVPSETIERAIRWNSSVSRPAKEEQTNYSPLTNYFECAHRDFQKDSSILHSPSPCCTSCQSSANLWICLACGCTSCGREELGGNNHSQQHSLETDHPLAIRYESIPSLNQKEIWCYKCDDLVQYENIRERIEELGISIHTPNKKFKTISEMEQDKYKDFISQDILPAGTTQPGILNIGNSCYMGSALQLLLISTGISEVFSGSDALKRHLESSHDHSLESACKVCQLMKITTGLCTASVKYLSPSWFKELWCNESIFETHDQQDVDEFLCYILENISELEKSSYLVSAAHFRKHFEIGVLNTSQCNHCNHITFREEWQWTLHLCLPEYVFNQELSEESYTTKSIDIQECLQATFETKIESRHCTNCLSTQEMKQKKTITQFPECLFAYIQKYYWDSKSVCIRKARVEIICDPFTADPITIFDRLKAENVLSEEELSIFREKRDCEYQVGEEKHQRSMKILTEQGYSPEKATDALRRFGGDPLKAQAFIDKHPNLQSFPSASTDNNFSCASEETCDISYKPLGYVTHFGAHAHSGHYVAYRYVDDSWFEFNDETVTQQSSCDMEKACLYAFARSVD